MANNRNERNRNNNNITNPNNDLNNRAEFAEDFDLNVEDINRSEEPDRELNKLRNKADNDC
ncbi:hypothetical protein ACFOZY_00635 [Chungangia koreensis]|uniref:YfhD family protein n=1 Tax=Chungangia koreensis TaxID=752657 RepID=A0ABV8WZ51_9LACT